MGVHSELKASSMEELINNLPDIISSKVILEDNEVVEIHVLASNIRGPKQISRDIQSALTARFNKKIDYKKVSVALIDEKHNVSSEIRLRVESVNLTLIGNTTEVKVTLIKDGILIDGVARGLGSKKNIYRLVAQATIDCIHRLLKVDDILTVEDVEKIYLAKENVMVVAVSYVAGKFEMLMTGTAVITKDEYETVVRATLDAINRRINKLPKES